MKSVIVMEKIKNTMQKSSKILGVICMLTIILSGCTANGSTDSSNQYGDSIATIDSMSYFWQLLGDDSAKIIAVKDNHIVSECIIKGPIVEAKQFDDGEIYIVCRNEQLCWFDVRNFPNELDLLTDEDMENDDISQENADSIINL